MMMFLPLGMLLLLSAGSARVVQNFQNECDGFFANRIPPTVFNRAQYRRICQTLDNTPYYATLYDTVNKIPVYSAYVFTGYMKCTRLDRWYIEPQLDDNNAEPNMAWKNFVSVYQASNNDYQSATDRFDRGHLAPVSQANSQSCADATFTLTNAAPQYSSFNKGQWRVIEGKLKKTVNNVCLNNIAYIVTGVVPGNENINNRVNVPSHFWTAYCCHYNTPMLISGGVLGVNSKDNQPPQQMNVRQLENNLTVLYGVPFFLLFDNNCGDARHVELI